MASVNDGGHGDHWSVPVSSSSSPLKPIDVGVVRQALFLLVDPSHHVMIQSFPSAQYRHFRGNDLDGIVKAVSEMGGGDGTYFSLNPYGKIPKKPDGDPKCISNTDIVARRWLLIDPDAKKPESLGPDVSTTDEEKESAKLVTEAIRDFLREQGWPDPIYVDSGNNWQLLYRVDLPNTDLAKELVSKCLKGLGKRFDTDRVGVDSGVFDARRICKIPGTWVRKGEDTAERPWRMSRLMSIPMDLAAVDVEMIKAVGGLKSPGKVEPKLEIPAPPPPRKADKDSWRLAANAGTLDVESRAIRYLATIDPAVSGQHGHNKAFYAACKVGPGFDLPVDTAIRLLMAHYNERCVPPWTEQEWRHKLEGAYENETRRGWLSEAPPKEGGKAKAGAAPTLKPAPEGRVIDLASEVTPRKVEWLWPGRIPLGKLTTFAGVGGLGKTFVLCDISARISRGDTWPDSAPDEGGEVEQMEAGKVLFVSGEDDPDDTLVPRMIEMGAVLDRIAFLKTEVLDRFTLADLPTLAKAIDQLGAGVRLVVIDPPTAYLGACDDHKNSELRALLSPLKSFASKHRVAVVFNTHVSKPQGAKVEAMMRVMGSVAWVNAVRAAHMFAKDPEDPSKRLFIGMKLNIGKEEKGLAYRITSTDTLAKVEWLGSVDSTADEALNGEKKKPRGVVATEWVTEAFRKKREWASDEIVDAAKEAGISRSALFSPEVAALPIRKSQHARGDGTRYWSWTAEPDWPPEEVTVSEPPASKRNSEIVKFCEPKPLQDNTNNRVPMGKPPWNSEDDRNSDPPPPSGSQNFNAPDQSIDARNSVNPLADNDLTGQNFTISEFHGDTHPDRNSDPDRPDDTHRAIEMLVGMLTAKTTEVGRALKIIEDQGVDAEFVYKAVKILKVVTVTIDGQDYWDLKRRSK